jgi:CPA1 family monovalent cation:H+ antiporter
MGFRVGYFLYRRLGVIRFLSDRLAERVEMLLTFRFLIEQIRAFNDREIRPIFGERIAELTGHILDQRSDAVASAFDALRRQYPDYASDLEERFLRQSALRQVRTRFQSMFDAGLIGREVYADLERGAFGMRTGHERPHFDIGLDAQRLIQHLDLFAGLEQGQLTRLCELLRPLLAVPKDRIIRAGERGEAVYFIASGAVEVIRPERTVRLGSGDFFGEMALVSGQPRGADVIALTYCQMLVLRRSDFDTFMDENPTARATIDRVARARRAMNMSG